MDFDHNSLASSKMVLSAIGALFHNQKLDSSLDSNHISVNKLCTLLCRVQMGFSNNSKYMSATF